LPGAPFGAVLGDRQNVLQQMSQYFSGRRSFTGLKYVILFVVAYLASKYALLAMAFVDSAFQGAH